MFRWLVGALVFGVLGSACSDTAALETRLDTVEQRLTAVEARPPTRAAIVVMLRQNGTAITGPNALIVHYRIDGEDFWFYTDPQERCGRSARIGDELPNTCKQETR